MNPFVIFAMPRSRSFWLSCFLSYGDWACGHDQARYVRSLDDVKSWLDQDRVGTVETGGASFWRLLRYIRPEAKIVVVRRDPIAAAESIMAKGLPLKRDVVVQNLVQIDRKLAQIEARVPEALCLRFEDLSEESVCARVFEHCLEQPHDHAWWAGIAPVNLQMNLRGLLAYHAAHTKQLSRTQMILKRETRSIILKNRPRRMMEGMTFQEETGDTWLRDGQHLFREHCVAVGEDPESWKRKNIPMMRKLERAGLCQIITARCNGRMFGYLTASLGPSVEHDDPKAKVAVQTLFYASPDVWGLGMMLQQAAIENLKARGGHWDVIQREGVRGSGPKLGAMYARMGAEPYGMLHKLSVEGH